jgi:hypothetical protein
MPRCPTCAARLSEDRERVGARCPSCRWPLYERAGRLPRPVQPGEAACGVHPDSESIGTCGRCGNFLCETCRTRWEDSVLCAACVDRALKGGDVSPGQKREHSRQAALGFSGGVAAWLLTGLVIGVLALLGSSAAGDKNPGVVLFAMFGMLLLPIAVIAALLGLGFSAAAIRTRGESMILATLGLMLSGLHVGALVGMFFVGIWLH